MFLKNFSKAQIAAALFGTVVAVLALVVMISLNKTTPDVKSAKRALLGLTIMAVLTLGYSLGTHAEALKNLSLEDIKSHKWTPMEMGNGIAGLVMVILALVAMGKLGKADVKEADVKSAKTSANLLVGLAVLTGLGNYFAKGKKAE